MGAVPISNLDEFVNSFLFARREETLESALKVLNVKLARANKRLLDSLKENSALKQRLSDSLKKNSAWKEELEITTVYLKKVEKKVEKERAAYSRP